MNTALHVLEPYARIATAAVANAIWQDAAIFAVTALLLRLWRRLNAATRYATWFVALVAAIAVPVLTALPHAPAPQAAVHTATAQREHAAAGVHANVAESRTTFATVTSPGAREPSASGAAFAPPSITVAPAAADAVLALWALLVAFFLARLFFGLLRLERLKKNALPLPFAVREAIAHPAPGGRDVRICVSDETEVPVAVGLFDSMILIPRHLLDSLSKEDLEQICLHEIAHLRRADDWMNLVQRVLTAFTWFSPGIYGIARGLDLEREVACDDDVIAETGSVRPYARCLTTMAEITAWPHRALAAPGVFVTRRGISERVERLLLAGRNAARGLAFAPTALAIAVLAFLGFGMRAIAPTAAAPTSTEPAVAARPAAARNSLAREAIAQATAPPATPASPATVVRMRVHARVHSVERRIEEREVRVPAVNVHVPAVNVSVPGVSVHVPPVNVNVPPVDVHIPAMNVPMLGGCRDCDYSGVDWSGRDLRGRHFVGADFSGADLRDADFRGTYLIGCDFSGAALQGANFDGARIEGCEFSGARLSATQARDILSSCNGCDMSHEDLAGADLSGLRMQGIDFSHANLTAANFRNAYLNGVDFDHAALGGAIFDGATLEGVDLDGVSLSHVDLSRARLIDVDLSSHERRRE